MASARTPMTFSPARSLLGALRAWLADRRGVAAIEFGMIAPVLVLSLVGAAQFSWILYLRNAVQQAADQTAHYAMIHPGATQDQLVAYAKQAAEPMDTNQMTVTVTWDTTAPTTFVTILTSYHEPIGVPFLPLDTITLVGRARVPQT